MEELNTFEAGSAKKRFYRMHHHLFQMTSEAESGFEFLDHTADVQIHAWAKDLKTTFAEAAKAMFAYMTDLDLVQEDRTLRISLNGLHDLEAALFGFLDEWLYQFSAESNFVPFKIDVLDLKVDEDSGEVAIEAVGYGETFDLAKHTQGTEVKAITYSAMQIIETANKAEVFVIIDI